MRKSARLFVVLGAFSMLVACGDKPHDYGSQRPDVDRLQQDDRGLQSKDLLTATDNMVRSLLSAPDLRESATQWTLVVDRVEDRTLDRAFNTNYDVFLERLRSNLARQGRGQITLLENKAKLQDLRGKELDTPPDAAAPSRVQPQYALYAKAMDMPNRATNYYLLEFTVTNMRTGVQVWNDHFEVKALR